MALVASLGLAAPAQARMAIQFNEITPGGVNKVPAYRPQAYRAPAYRAPAEKAPAFSTPFPDYLQCVPYARAATGIQLYGDAHTWWSQANGRYSRGTTPKVGAVMAFKPYGKMVLGHVAAVSRIIDSRHVLLRHANWSPINGRRGQVERDVEAVDTSPANDWSEVRVWFDPIKGLGGTRWPVQGFIYNKQPARGGTGSGHGLARTGRGSDPIGAIIAALLGRR